MRTFTPAPRTAYHLPRNFASRRLWAARESAGGCDRPRPSPPPPPTVPRAVAPRGALFWPASVLLVLESRPESRPGREGGGGEGRQEARTRATRGFCGKFEHLEAMLAGRELVLVTPGARRSASAGGGGGKRRKNAGLRATAETPTRSVTTERAPRRRRVRVGVSRNPYRTECHASRSVAVCDCASASGRKSPRLTRAEQTWRGGGGEEPGRGPAEGATPRRRSVVPPVAGLPA